MNGETITSDDLDELNELALMANRKRDACRAAGVSMASVLVRADLLAKALDEYTLLSLEVKQLRGRGETCRKCGALVP